LVFDNKENVKLAEKRKRVDLSKLRKKQLKYLRDLQGPPLNSGVGNTPRPNPYPIYWKAENEVVLGNEGTGVRIVCGADRPGNIASGHGGAGEQRCGAIRMVAGPMGSFATSVDINTGEQLYASPSNEYDAATCYVSANSDVDEDFRLADGTVGNVKDRSSFVAKADSLRLISRDGGIKIIAGGDRFNSRGGEIKSVPEINLITNNDESGLQPIPKGENLRKALIKMNKNIQNLLNVVAGFLESQLAFNSALMTHTHVVPPMIIMIPNPIGIPPFIPGGFTTVGTTAPSIEAAAAGTISGGIQASLDAPSLVIMAANTALFSFNYFQNPSGPKYINSRNVKTT
tara:strand:- start:1711 stop:2739 length:1029 start_codon:yes stop_codon:yes gene_type:complete